MKKRVSNRMILSELFTVALKAVNGQNAVERALHKHPVEGDIAIIAIGKAAAAMMHGAKNLLKTQIQSALIITKQGHADNTLAWPCIEAGHPIPNAKSLEAGSKLLEFMENIPKNTKLLALISGGTSALVEVLADDMDLNQLQKLNKWLLASGLTIHEMNKIRQAVSLIKGGKALAYLRQKEMTQLLISDVKFDDITCIGSGLFVVNEQNNALLEVPEWIKLFFLKSPVFTQESAHSHIIANNEMACQAIIERAKQLNYRVIYHGQTLYGDVFDLAKSITEELIASSAGLHIWGGEPTIKLPENVGRGGRNQSLALAIACEIENIRGITVLVGATDGNDGATEDAGAIIDGLTLQRASGMQNATKYLENADAGTYLEQAGDLISTGPTGTNVMDIVIALKDPITAAS